MSTSGGLLSLSKHFSRSNLSLSNYSLSHIRRLKGPTVIASILCAPSVWGRHVYTSEAFSDGTGCHHWIVRRVCGRLRWNIGVRHLAQSTSRVAQDERCYA